jgi:hypothetical protein
MTFVDTWPPAEAFEEFAEQELSDAAEVGPIEPRVVPMHDRRVVQQSYATELATGARPD